MPGQKPRRSNAKSVKEAGARGGLEGAPRTIFQREKTAKPKTNSEPDLRKLKGKDLDLALKARFPKKSWDPSVLLMPNPVVLISCGGGKSKLPQDIITVAWAGIVNTTPPMVSVSLRPERFSHEIISQTKEFVINLPTAALVKAVDWIGMKSGRDTDKFTELKLTALPGEQVDCPVVADCPVNIECKVTKVIPLGSHDLFLAKVLGVQVSETVLDKKGKLRVDLADLMGYAHGEYHELGRKLGTFGFSVKKH